MPTIDTSMQLTEMSIQKRRKMNMIINTYMLFLLTGILDTLRINPICNVGNFYNKRDNLLQ